MTDQPQFKPSSPASPGSMTRSAFFRLSPADQFRAIREGWTLTDDPPGSQPAPTITRRQFDGMPEIGRQLFLSRGGVVAE